MATTSSRPSSSTSSLSFYCYSSSKALSQASPSLHFRPEFFVSKWLCILLFNARTSFSSFDEYSRPTLLSPSSVSDRVLVPDTKPPEWQGKHSQDEPVSLLSAVLHSTSRPESPHLYPHRGTVSSYPRTIPIVPNGELITRGVHCLQSLGLSILREGVRSPGRLQVSTSLRRASSD